MLQDHYVICGFGTKRRSAALSLVTTGASVVITSDAATGRLLGMAMESPHQAEMIEDLLLVGHGMDLVEHEVADTESGRPIPPGTVGIIGHGHMVREVDTFKRETVS